MGSAPPLLSAGYTKLIKAETEHSYKLVELAWWYITLVLL